MREGLVSLEGLEVLVEGARLEREAREAEKDASGSGE